MAVYECDFGRHRYPQAQQSIYFTHVIGSSVDTYKMRLCPSHFRDSVVKIQEHMSQVDEESRASQDCDFCHGQKVGALYAKVFAAKLPQTDWVIDVCADDLSRLGNELRIFNGSHLNGRSDTV